MMCSAERPLATALLLLIIAATGWFALLPRRAAGQAPPALDAVYDSVVSIKTTRSGTHAPEDWSGTTEWSAEESGSGLIVAVDGQRIRVLTAHHVVAGDEGATTITLSFPGLRGVLTNTKVLVVSDALDLALVETKLPAGVHLHRDPAVISYPGDHAVKRTMPVWTVDNELDSVPNTVTRLDVDADTRKFLYTGNSIGKGYSGGPVFDDHARLVGLHLASRSKSDYKLSIAVNIDAALDFLNAKGYEAATLNKLSAAKAVTGLNLTGDPIERLHVMGLKFDVESFAEAVGDGTLPAIKAYLDAGMSPHALNGISDLFILDVPAMRGTEDFPEIVKEFADHKADFNFVNPRYQRTGRDGYFYLDQPETMQDQLWLTLSQAPNRQIAVANGKALLAAGASPLRAARRAQDCGIARAEYCTSMLTFLAAIGYKAAEPTRATDTSKRDGKAVHESKAAGPADRESMRGVGYGYLADAGAIGDYSESLKWFRKAAGLGDGPSMTAIGYQYFMGLGVAQSDDDAAEWFRKGAAAGDTDPLATLEGVLDSKHPKRSNPGPPRPWEGPRVQSWFLFRTAVLDKKPLEYYLLADNYLLGENGVQKNVARGTHFLQVSADLGYTEAMNQLSEMYSHGDIVPLDARQALVWLQKSANAGDASAESVLGAQYARGVAPLRRDDRQAVYWLQKAATGGSPQGMTNLAIMYQNGLGGLPKDNNQAIFWYRKAAALGEPTAQQALGGSTR